MSKIPVSVCLIAKNEEKYIEECLKCLLPYGFEIVVTDTGSTDRTKEIAMKYADKVLDFEWIDDFSAARNFCASHASNNWIMAIDCDEYVSSINVQGLRILMQRYPKFLGAFDLKNLVIGADGKDRYSIDRVVRMYNRNYYTYISSIHEQITYKDEAKRNEVQNTFVIPMEIIHHGYYLTPEEMLEKQKRNLEMLYQNIEKSPDDPYLLFQAGQSEHIIGNYAKSIEHFEKSLEKIPSIEYAYVQVMITTLARSYCYEERQADALELMNRYADQIKTAKYAFTHASVLLENGQPLKSLLMYLKIVTMEDRNDLGANLLNCYENIMMLYREMGQDDMADMFIDKYNECKMELDRVMNA